MNKHVQTKVQYHGQRKPGDAPSLGKVARMPGTGLPRELRKRSLRGTGRTSSRRMDRRRIRQMRARKFAITMWLSIILLVCVSAMSVGMFMWLRSQGDRKNIAPLFVREDSLPALHLTDFPPPSEREALEIIRNALDARDEDTLGIYVHDTHEIDAAGIIDFLAATAERDGELLSHQWIGSSDTERLQIQSMHLVFEKDGRHNSRLAMLVPNETGNWRLDFPSYARWCEPPIQLMNRPEGYPGGRVRVVVARDHYYNGPFTDDREWVCYTIDSPDSETNGFAYCPVGSPEHQTLEAMMARDARQLRATLDIERVEDANVRQFRIAKVVSENWVAVDAPAKESAE